VRVLHVGFGFRPWRSGGLIAYVEDVVRAQARRGHEPAYFFAGRHVPRGGVHLRRWERDGVAMFELWNSRVTVGVGTLDPDRDLSEPAAERAFETVLDRWRPDVVHIQELLGLPSSLLEIARAHGVPVVVSIEDYQLLCPTVKLYDANGDNCRRPLPGAMCRVCCAHAPTDNGYLVRRSIEQIVLPGGERTTMAANNLLNSVRYKPRVRSLLDRLRSRREDPPPAATEAPASAEAYDRRRAVNVERMSGADVVLAMSHGVADICRDLGVTEERLRVVHFTLAHLWGIQPSPRVAPQNPMRFATLNGCSSVEKGLDVILDALGHLRDQGLADRFRLLVWGFVHPWARDALEAHPSVELRGNYTDADLERMLADADVGIVPSVWEEAYGYTGVELLAAGVPVIGNARGGIPDYVRPGDTGWLNESAGAAELAGHMQRLIATPDEVAARRLDLRRRRPEAVKPMAAHLDELDAVYQAVLAGAPVPSR
jgi:glycosyltransferase involved in cell wall biosynthesis